MCLIGEKNLLNLMKKQRRKTEGLINEKSPHLMKKQEEKLICCCFAGSEKLPKPSQENKRGKPDVN